MKKKFVGLAVASLIAFVGCLVQAKTFKNAYISFEMPDTWDCKLEHTEWVCRSNVEKESKEAIIILTAKEKGPTDEIPLYKTHLGTPQPPAFRGGQQALSQVQYPPKDQTINDQTWVDGLHLSSEIPGYFTRYMATIKDRIAILVTFSAHRDHYTKYSSEFFRAIQSMRVIATPNLLGNSQVLRPGEGGIFGQTKDAIPGDMPGATELMPNANPGNKGKLKTILMGIAFLLVLAALYIYMKSRKS